MMEQIPDINLSVLNNNEHAQFMSDVCSKVVDAGGPEILLIPDEYTLLRKGLDKEEEAMRIESGSSKTTKVKKYDIKRDNTWNAIDKRVKITLLSPIDGEPEAASALLYVLNKYGDLRWLPYNEETKEISNLLVDLAQPENVAHLATLGMQPWVNALESQNKNFIAIQSERTAEKSERTDGNVGNARKVVDPLYDALIKKINASVIMQVAPAVTSSFVAQVNLLIKDCETTVAKRLASGKKSSEDDNNASSSETA